ncbi:MAG: T9SS type A sorting domain-containing protein [Saprospiraceae bacterium]
MKLENFKLNNQSTLGKSIKTGLLSTLFLLCFFGQASAQCPLGCNNSVQISLDDDCMVEVTPDMVLEGQGTNDCDYIVTVLGSNGQPIPGSPMVGSEYVGETLTVKVSLGANSCWGTIKIEDKLPPQIDCPGDMTVSCYQSSNFSHPTATDNCSGIIPVDVVSDETEDLDCTNLYSAKRTITFQATDEAGNKSAFCVKTIYFERIPLDSIVFPKNRDGVELPMLECDNIPHWDDNGDKYPQPEETGTPMTTDGYNIFPNNSYCELNATYTDQLLPICESSFKVLRKWIVLDWCTGELEEEFQIIKVVDNEIPIVTCVPDDPHAVSADPYNCTGSWDVPDPIVIYDCSSTTYTVSYLEADASGNAPANGVYVSDNVITNSDGSYTIRNLKLGRTWVRYTITDGCGNYDHCFTEIDVIDDVPPIPVCDEFTTATLTNNGYAHIFAETFDDGSHDNCSEVDFEVRRMTPGCGASTSQWTEYVEFCCADIGKEIMVSLRVTDKSGNSNTCMVIVTVQDKLDPTIECPPNITLNCGADYLDMANTGGSATGDDNCGNVTITHNDTGSLNSCGVGTINRRFTATDAGGKSVSCTQRITVQDNTPFNGSSINWPGNKTINGCANIDTDPSSTGTPSYNDDQCSQVADTYEDQVFEFVDGVCLKILRTWTVIDWCTFNQNNPSAGGIWQYTQIIKVTNTVAPTFTSSCSNITVEAFGENCNEFVTLIAEATDDCTPDADIEYSYTVDEGNNGSIDRIGSTNDATGTYAVGLHKVTFTAEDQCGNQKVCMYTFNVVDRKKPTPYCLSEITTVIMPTSGDIQIWASDYDLGSFDNCPGTVKLSFSGNVNNTSKTFTCDDLGVNDIEIWVTDVSGNQDFCSTQINIQSNGGCDGARISGDVASLQNEMIEEVMVTLQNMSNQETNQMMTPNSGHYLFQGIPTETNYVVKAAKNTDHSNGVSTLDLVLIQRHILEIESLDSPYKIIAADVNGNESISASDLLALRKLILGVWVEYQDNTSWRFVDAAQVFADNNDPFPFTEKISVSNFNENDLDNNFVGVKIGDVNNSASTINITNNNISATRNANTISLSVVNLTYQKDDVVTIPVTAENFTEMVGMQMTMNMTDLEMIDITPGVLNITTSNTAQFEKQEAATFSWNTPNAITANNDDVLFTLILKANADGVLSNNLNVSSSMINSEAYNSSLEIANVEMIVRNENEITNNSVEFELFQNTPNPFEGMTTVQFTLPNTGKATVKVMDLTGKVIFTNTKTFNKGMNEMSFDNNTLSANGVLFYQIEFNGKIATKKMVSM